MKRLYSESTQTTYLIGVHTAIPDDAVEISDELYLSVIGNPPDGKIRAHDKNGLPYLIDAPELVPDLPALERQWRDQELASLAWLRDRHRDQVEIGSQTTLTSEQFGQLLVYMQALRDWPQSPDFPNSLKRPVGSFWGPGQTKG